jgi:hypothetical protein
MNRMLILLTLACTAAGAADKQQVYKWTDASGVVHFTDTPPPRDTPNVQSVRMVGGGTSTTPTEDATKAAAPVATASATASTPANNQPPDEATLCKQSRANLELLQGKTPVGIAGTDGKASVLDDKARDAQIANAKLAIARFCK